MNFVVDLYRTSAVEIEKHEAVSLVLTQPHNASYLFSMNSCGVVV